MNLDKVEEGTYLDFTAQAAWELEAIAKAHVVMFYLGTEERLMPGLVTRTEFGFSLGNKYCISICAPKGLYRIGYMKFLGSLQGYDVFDNLEDSIKNILKICHQRNSTITMTNGRYNSTIIEVKKDCCNSLGSFDAINFVKDSIEKALSENKKGAVYVRFPEQFFNIIGLLSKYGFKLYRYLEDEGPGFEYYCWNGRGPSKVPDHATSIEGACLIVFDQKKNKILLIEEDNLLKFVSGAVNKGESHIDAALRELYEEVGIPVDKLDMTTFKRIGGYNQANARLGKINDNYRCFAVTLKEDVELKVDLEEIQGAGWYDPDFLFSLADKINDKDYKGPRVFNANVVWLKAFLDGKVYDVVTMAQERFVH